jgi:prepilin-type N-terminal cleavage/methylation domain-containing protein
MLLSTMGRRSIKLNRANKKRGLTLVEVMVAIGLIAVSLMLVLALIPAGIQSAQRAENVQSAAAWSRQLIEDAPVPEEFPIPDSIAKENFQETIGRTKYRAERRLSTVPGEFFMYRIEVEIEWDEGVRPLTLSLVKYNPAGPAPDSGP